MKMKNKWNHKIYMVLSIEGNIVKLQRSDGTEFIISKKDFDFNYYEIRK